MFVQERISKHLVLVLLDTQVRARSCSGIEEGWFTHVKIFARAAASMAASVAEANRYCMHLLGNYARGPVGKQQRTNKKQAPGVGICFWAWIITFHCGISTWKAQSHPY